MAKKTTVIVGLNKLEVTVDMKAGVEYIQSYDYDANPRELSVKVLETLFAMKETLDSGKSVTPKQVGYAKALFMKMIVPVDPSAVVKEIQCVHVDVVEGKRVRCENVIEGTRRELGEAGNECDEH